MLRHGETPGRGGLGGWYRLSLCRKRPSGPRMEEPSRPGPKPKRLFLRVVRFGDAGRSDLPRPRELRTFLRDLERVGRLVAHGPLREPPGDLLLLRATGVAEALRALRRDPFRDRDGTSSELLAWGPTAVGSGVNLDLPPARGAGRLTLLQRVSVVVRDQRRALAWYRDVLGLEVRVDEPETGYVELALGKGAVALALVEPRREWGEPYYSEALARVGVPTGIAFQTDSVLALSGRLAREGAGVTEPPRAQPWGGVALRFQDPDGNEFLAFEPSGPARAPSRAAAGPGRATPAARPRPPRRGP